MKKLIIILIPCIIIIGAIVLLLFKDKWKEKNEPNDFIYISEYQNKLIDNDYLLLESIEEHNNIFTVSQLESNDFIDSNYLLFSIRFNECGEKNIQPVSYTLIDNTLNINVEYSKECGVCAPKYNYYFLKLKKDITFDEVSFDYHVLNDIFCDNDRDDKPIIYLYPEEEMNVSVKLLNDKYLTTTYPKYQNGWNVYAYPNGDLIDNNTGRSLYSLYWEGDNHQTLVKEDGFVVKKEDTITFLEEKLAILGLNEREANEFIIYWLPKMEHNAYNYIRFETIEEINNYMPLEISPKPDTVIRVQMDFKGLNEKIEVIEQELTTPNRNGFTVVEWGGSIIK